MRKGISILVFLFIITGGFHALSQTKIGHVNTELITKDLPEYKQMLVKIQDEQNRAQKEMMKLDSAYKTIALKLNQPTISEFEKIELEHEMQKLEKLAQTRPQELEENIYQLQQKLQMIIIEKVKKAIKEVGDEGGYTYVMDDTVMYYINGGNDLTNAVRQKLGLPPVSDKTN